MGILDRSEAIFSWAMKLRQIGRVHVGRITGTCSNNRGDYKTLIHLVERTMFLRAEVNALTQLLIKKGVFKEKEWERQWEIEIQNLFHGYAKDFPEIEFTDKGFIIKDKDALYARSMKEEWPP